MRIYQLKNIAGRSAAFMAAVSLLTGVGSGVLPVFASADALNPLTERTLTLSSSSPGWSFTDGSGNSRYAGPNTGANGQKTGNTFTFRTSSAKTVQAFTFQYCTASAGQCKAPGNDSDSSTPGTDDSSHSDLNIVTDDSNADTPTAPVEVSGADYATLSANTTATATGAGANTNGDAAKYGDVLQVPDGQDNVSPYDKSAFGGTDDSNGKAGNFVVLYGSSATGHVSTYSGGWDMTAANQEEATSGATGKVNMITLKANGTTNTGLVLGAGDYVKVMFFGTDSNYITNPGEGAFFVKINDYDSTDYQNFAKGIPDAATDCNGGTTWVGGGTGDSQCESNVIDGGVTVANVMNQSIQITTKVLETMDFSVGTVDPDTLTAGSTSEYATATTGPGLTPRTAHTACDPILNAMAPTDPANTLVLGDQTAENSLSTSHTYATHSYWRLSSNSSGGATVYYAGNTLSNTEGDEIAPIGTAEAAPQTGAEQFGLAIDSDLAAANDGYAVNYTSANTTGNGGDGQYENGADATATSKGAALDGGFSTYVSTTANDVVVHSPRLAPLVPLNDYKDGAGVLTSGTPKFAFDPNANTVPAAIATESSQVVNCVTAKMRYIGNIAAITPAGIYTTKINYIAAPQY